MVSCILSLLLFVFFDTVRCFSYCRQSSPHRKHTTKRSLTEPNHNDHNSSQYTPTQQKSIHSARFLQWGAHNHHPTPTFPQTLDSVTDAAFDAISSTFYDQQRPDPNIASNAMSRSVLDYRPVRQRHIGRIGIEIDGAEHLLCRKRKEVQDEEARKLEGVALGRLSLLLASKLSKRPWGKVEDTPAESLEDYRPVVVYFPTLRQTLEASYQLLLLRRREQFEHPSSSLYNHIQILCLSQNDVSLPPDMKPHHPQPKKRNRSRASPTYIHPQNGLAVVVQPPAPLLHNLQTLVARCALTQIPCIFVSSSQLFHPSVPQQPWLFRDFIPPVYSWVCDDGSSQRNKVALCHSVMDLDHPWHVFVDRRDDGDGDERKDRRIVSDYRYIASTITSCGRPSPEIIAALLAEWG